MKAQIALFWLVVVGTQLCSCALATSHTEKESFFEGNLLYSNMTAPRFAPCGIKDETARLTGIRVLETDRLQKFASENHVPLCNSCGYYFACLGQIVRVGAANQDEMAFHLNKVIEFREHRTGDCDTEPKQD